MNLSTRLRVYATTVLSVGLMFSVAPADAQTLFKHDLRGDMHWYDADGNSATARGHRESDIVRIRFTHAARRVGVLVRFAALKPTQDHMFELNMLTSKGTRREVIFTRATNGRTFVTMYRPNGDEVACHVGHYINFSARVVTMSFARSCISSPRWVRLGFGAYGNDGTRYYADDALRHGPRDVLMTVGNNVSIRLSRRLARG